MGERVERRFRFRIAPELLRSRAQRDAIEREFADLERVRRESEAAVAHAAQELDACRTTQREEREQLRLAMRMATCNADWLGRARFLEELRVDESAKSADLQARRADERLARHKCELVRSELGTAQARVRALESLQENQRSEHRKALARQDDRKLDELSVERWTPRSNDMH